MRFSAAGNIRLMIWLPAGVSAAHGSDAWTSKNIAPFKRTARNTADNASIATPQTLEHERRTTGHSKPRPSSLHFWLSDEHQLSYLRSCCHEHFVRALLLWRSAVRSYRCSRRDGLLPLRILPSLVSRSGERIFAVESG